MTSLPRNTAHKLQGTYEIDANGKISYFFSAFETDEINRRMIGQNFYDYLRNALISDEIEAKIKTFIAGSATTDSFNIDYIFEGLRQKVLVLLGRIRGRSHRGTQDLIVIDIKPDSKRMDLN